MRNSSKRIVIDGVSIMVVDGVTNRVSTGVTDRVADRVSNGVTSLAVLPRQCKQTNKQTNKNKNKKTHPYCTGLFCDQSSVTGLSRHGNGRETGPSSALLTSGLSQKVMRVVFFCLFVFQV